MANRRVLVKRRKAIQNIRKITRTMQLIATARFQAAFGRATASRPYVERLAELVAELSRGTGEASHPLLATPAGDAPVAVLVLTSNRGLCGGYNAHVLRTAAARLDELAAAGTATELHVFGKKGIGYFRFQRRPMSAQHGDLGDTPRYEEVEPFATELMRRFLAGEISAVEVVHMRFHSAGLQRPEQVPLLPLRPPATAAAGEGVEYELRPGARELLDELLPATVRIRLFQAFQEAAISEQSARMVAMKAATDAAEEMIRTITRQYNRARQTHITMELLDIIGGANALS